MTLRRLAPALIAAALVLAGCAATSVPTPTASEGVAAPASEATPTPEPPQARVPFDGDCSGVLTADLAAQIFHGVQPVTSSPDNIGGLMPDVAGSLARLGGLACTWWAEGAPVEYLSVAVIPRMHVPDDVAAERAQFGCYGWGYCGRGEVRSDMWVLAETARVNENDLDPSAEEASVMTAAVDGLIQSVLGHAPSVYSGVPVSPAADWWTLPACEKIASAAASGAGITAPQPGFPGDNVPDGPVWEVLTAAGVAQWCPWYDLTENSSRITELQLQSGVGAPSAAQLEAHNVETISIAGADAAYRLVYEYSGGARGVEILVVDGPNRLLVGGYGPEAVAAAVLAVL
ncbi:hypothetical protein [Microbacterium timonense]|uniref:hypothetical protein n=1 Tax=Microbacterium timonense TaxID=2086576 RepID=UPI000D0FDF66|nr:hypothetical protein [Microbacterium timonense]